MEKENAEMQAEISLKKAEQRVFCSYRVLFRVPLRKPNAKWAYSQLGWILGWNLNRWEIV